jgi:hypothetical protein
MLGVSPHCTYGRFAAQSEAFIRLDFMDQVAVVRIKVFGMHSTGGHSTPYFGLEVMSGPDAESYRPRPSRGGVSGNGYRSFSAVTDRIYEIY